MINTRTEFFYCHQVSENKVPINPRGEQALDKEFPPRAPRIIQGKVPQVYWPLEIFCIQEVSNLIGLDLGKPATKTKGFTTWATPRGYENWISSATHEKHPIQQKWT